MADPFFNNVVLLCHFDGTNLSTLITDSSAATHTVSAFGPALTTVQKKFGSASLAQSATGHYSTSADSEDWNFGAGQFTVEAWVRPTVAITGTSTIVSQYNVTASNNAWSFRFGPTSLGFAYSTLGTDTIQVTGTYSPVLSQWVHVAADRDSSGTLRVYADGVVIATAFSVPAFFNSTLSLIILNDQSAARGLLGQIDDLRITKGVARYGGAFLVPQEAFPDALGPNPGINLSGTVREVLLTSNPNLNVAGVIREVLMSSAGTAVAVLEQQTAVSVIT